MIKTIIVCDNCGYETTIYDYEKIEDAKYYKTEDGKHFCCFKCFNEYLTKSSYINRNERKN